MNQEPQKRIHKNAIKAWKLSSSIYGLFYFIPAFLYAFIVIVNVDEEQSWIQAIDWLLFTVLFLFALFAYFTTLLIFPKLRWKRWRYDVSDKEIDMQRGIIIIKRTVVPMNRVQHVDTKKGPIYNTYGLSSVTISTAATTHEIPALDDETADDLRNTISTLVRKVKEDV